MSNGEAHARQYSIKPADLARFPNRRHYLGFEGGSVSLAEDGERFYVIVDEGTMMDFLDEEDQGLAGIHIAEFDTEMARTDYLTERGWFPAPEGGRSRRQRTAQE